MKPGGFENPQWGQLLSSLAPHFPQNCIPAGFSNRHLGHFIGTIPWQEIEDAYVEGGDDVTQRSLAAQLAAIGRRSYKHTKPDTGTGWPVPSLTARKQCRK